MVKDATSLIAKLDLLEEKLHNPKAEVTYDILARKGGARLYSQLAQLYEWLKDSDGPITQGMREVYAEQAKELRHLETVLQGLVTGDLNRLNNLVRKLELPHVIVPSAAKTP